MKAVEEHERDWGNEAYPNRPGLLDILNTPVVVFWKSTEKDDPETITLHQDLDEIRKHFVRILIASHKNSPKKRISRIFEDQQRIAIKDVQVIFGKASEGE